MAPRREKPKPAADEEKPKPQGERKHWLEYAIFLFVIATAGATGWAAYFTQQQWIVSSDAEKRQLRAYVGILPGDIENVGDRAKQRFTFTRKNYGLTPAYDATVVTFGQAVIPKNGNVPTGTAPPPDIRGTVTLFPSAELPFHVTGIAVAQDQVDYFLKGDDWEFVYFGTVQYHDAFEQRHFTYFCWMYTRNSLIGKDAEGCFGHNDSN